MTVAETLAEFLIDVPSDDLSDRAVDHAAMLIASSTASAACGTTLTFEQLAMERGGQAEATA